MRYPKPPILGSTIVKNITHIPFSIDGEESAIIADARLKLMKLIIDQIAVSSKHFKDLFENKTILVIYL